MGVIGGHITGLLTAVEVYGLIMSGMIKYNYDVVNQSNYILGKPYLGITKHQRFKYTN